MTDVIMRVIAKQAHLDPSVIKPELSCPNWALRHSIWSRSS